MVRRIRHGAVMGLIAWMAVADAPVGAQVPPGSGTAVPVAIGSDAAPGELQAWDARLDGMIRTGQLVVVSRTDDPTLADRTHEYAAQFVDGLPVLGAGVTRQFANGTTLSAFGTLHEGVHLNTAPAITAAEARVMIERQTGARLAIAHTPELSVLPLPTATYVLVYGAAFDDGRYHFASAADGRLVHSLDALRSQSAIGTGLGILGDRKKMSTLFHGARYETHDQLRPSEIVTLDVEFDAERYWRLVTSGPSDVRRWTSQDIAADADNDWSPQYRGGRWSRPHGLDVRLLRPAARLGGGRRAAGTDHRPGQRVRRLQRDCLPSAVRPRGPGGTDVRPVPRPRGAGRSTARRPVRRCPRAHAQRRLPLRRAAHRFALRTLRHPHRGRVADAGTAELHGQRGRDPHLPHRDVSPSSTTWTDDGSRSRLRPCAATRAASCSLPGRAER